MSSISWRGLRHDPAIAEAIFGDLMRLDHALAAVASPDEALAALGGGAPTLVLGALVFDPRVTADVLERRAKALSMVALPLGNAPPTLSADRARVAAAALAGLAIAESCGLAEGHVGAAAAGAWLGAIQTAAAPADADTLGRAALTALVHGRVPRAESLLARVGKPNATSEMARALVKVRGNVANEDRVMATALEIFPGRYASGRGDAVAMWLAARIVFEAHGRTVREAPLELFRRVLALAASGPLESAGPRPIVRPAVGTLAEVEAALAAAGVSGVQARADAVSRLVIVSRDEADAAAWKKVVAALPAAKGAQVAALLASGDPEDRVDGARLAGFLGITDRAPTLRRLTLTADGWTAAAAAWALRTFDEPEPWANGAAVQVSVDEDDEDLDLVVGGAEAEQSAAVEAERAAKLEAERVEAARLAAIEAERVAKLEAERVAKLEAERVAKLEAERVAKLEAGRLAAIEAERVARLEAERAEAARLAAIEAARVEAARLAAIEAARLAAIEAERVEAERLAAIEAERLAAIEAARVEAERLAAIEAARVEAERIEAERLAAIEAERVEAERLAAIEAERLAAIEAARVEVARVEAERIEAERAEAARLAAIEAARVEAEPQTSPTESVATESPEPAAAESVATESPEPAAAESVATESPEPAAAEPVATESAAAEPAPLAAAPLAAAPAAAVAGVAAAARAPKGRKAAVVSKRPPPDPTDVDVRVVRPAPAPAAADEEDDIDLGDELEPTASPGTALPRPAPLDLRALVAGPAPEPADASPGSPSVPPGTGGPPPPGDVSALAPPDPASPKPVNVVQRKGAADDMADEAIAAMAVKPAIAKPQRASGGIPGWLLGMAIGLGVMLGCGGMLGAVFWVVAIR